jgi:hypothetical protein
VSDLVLLSSRDLSNSLSGLSSLSAHVGTLGETAKLYRVLVTVGSEYNRVAGKLTVSTIMPVIW